MSTKVYNAFSVKMPFNKFYSLLEKEIRPAVQAFGIKRLKKLAVLNAVETYDAATIKNEKPEEILVKGILDIMERQRKVEKTQQRDPEVDYSFEVLMYPSKGNRIPFRILTEHEKSYVCFTNDLFPGIKEESYWNNTDRPDDVSPQEWRRRARLWNSRLDSRPVCYTACEIDEFLYRMMPSESEFKSLTPEFHVRLEKTAIKFSLNSFYEKQGDLNFSELFKYVESNEHKKLIDEKMKDFSSVLKQEIQFSELISKNK